MIRRRGRLNGSFSANKKAAPVERPGAAFCEGWSTSDVPACSPSKTVFNSFMMSAPFVHVTNTFSVLWQVVTRGDIKVVPFLASKLDIGTGGDGANALGIH